MSNNPDLRDIPDVGTVSQFFFVVGGLKQIGKYNIFLEEKTNFLNT